MRIKKYITIVNTFWQRALAYRFTVAAYRLGEIAEILALILMWSVIYQTQDLIKGFTRQEMITYLLIGNLFQATVRNFLADAVARDIKEGELSMLLIRPMSYFSYVLTKEVGRISLATLMSIASQMLVISFFLDTFILNTDPVLLLIIGAMVFLAFITELLLSYLVGCVAFWTDEVDGLYMTIMRLKKFFSGGYFPLSLLPTAFVDISFLLPFAYSFFVPSELYLKKIGLEAGFKGIVIQLIWIVLLFGIGKIVWKQGLKRYEGIGI